jgi:hypothetical protein
MLHLEAAMDESEKARVRQWAQRRYRRSLVLLPLIALILIGEWWFSTWRAGTYNQVRANVSLSRAAGAVTTEFARFYFSQCRSLTVFPPPTEVESESEWAAQIEQFLGQLAAVYVANNHDVRWARMPEKFRADSARLDRSVRVEENLENRGKRVQRDLGGMEILSWAVAGNPSNHAVWMVGPKGASQRWGAALNVDDFWDVLARDLRRADSSLSPDSPATSLRDVVELSPRGSQIAYPGLRIIHDGAIIFESPGLDTTLYCYTNQSPGLTMKLYQSKMDRNWSRVDRFRVGYLVCAILVLCFLVPIRRWYKKVMLLTEAA